MLVHLLCGCTDTGEHMVKDEWPHEGIHDFEHRVLELVGQARQNLTLHDLGWDSVDR